MKTLKSTTFLLVLLISVSLNSQDYTGEITFGKVETLDLSRFDQKIDKEHLDALKENLNKKNSIKYTLIFNKKEALYKREDHLKTVTSRDKIYKNISKNQYLENYELYGKLLLIEDDLINFNWKLIDSTKKVGKFKCFMAKGYYYYIPKESISYADLNKTIDTITKKREVIAWYTTDIPISNGPDIFTNLPGMILEVQLSHINIFATEVKLNTINRKGIIAPKKGMKISRKEFEILRNKKIKERNSILHDN